jgi:hypothetical protein
MFAVLSQATQLPIFLLIEPLERQCKIDCGYPLSLDIVSFTDEIRR